MYGLGVGARTVCVQARCQVASPTVRRLPSGSSGIPHTRVHASTAATARRRRRRRLYSYPESVFEPLEHLCGTRRGLGGP